MAQVGIAAAYSTYYLQDHSRPCLLKAYWRLEASQSSGVYSQSRFGQEVLLEAAGGASNGFIGGRGLHLDHLLQLLLIMFVLWPLKGVASHKHDIQHHTTRPDVRYLQTHKALALTTQTLQGLKSLLSIA